MISRYIEHLFADKRSYQILDGTSVIQLDIGDGSLDKKESKLTWKKKQGLQKLVNLNFLVDNIIQA